MKITAAIAPAALEAPVPGRLGVLMRASPLRPRPGCPEHPVHTFPMSEESAAQRSVVFPYRRLFASGALVGMFCATNSMTAFKSDSSAGWSHSMKS